MGNVQHNTDNCYTSLLHIFRVEAVYQEQGQFSVSHEPCSDLIASVT
jgi:hypothetical protein